DLARVARVRLDAAHHGDMVGLIGAAVEINSNTLFGFRDADNLHGRADRRTAIALCDAIAFNNLSLPFCGAAAVPARRRYDERLGADFHQTLHDCANNEGNVGDAPTAGRDGNGLTGTNYLANLNSCQLGSHRSPYISNTWCFETLPNSKHL